MGDWSTRGTFAFRARPIDVDPLTVAAAFGELVDPQLSHRNPARHAEFLPNMLGDSRKSEFRHHRSSGSAFGPCPPLSFGQELLNDRRRLGWARHEKQMTVIKDFKAGV